MKGRLLALIVGMLLIGVVPATASASSFGEQTAGQDAGNTQSATSGATSTQINPSNENISVRVLSPGDNGNVSQSNNSSAASGALNANLTGQGTSQVQSGGSAASKALQTAAQEAGNDQSATSNADSKQVHPDNENISVRVLSPGDDGDVTQSNNSDAKSFAGNKNALLQKTDQSQGGSGKPSDGVLTSDPCHKGCDNSSDTTPSRVVKDPCGCDSGSKAIQAAGQDANSSQTAKSDATSKQIHPENQNDPLRIKSEGDNGSVDQSNNSSAESFAGNLNFTKQDIKQSQAGMSGGVVLTDLARGLCGCDFGSKFIQAGGQDAWNKQDAKSNADSEQIGASNDNEPLRVKHSDGSNGDVSQENNSSATSKALNLNKLLQLLQQMQDLSGGGGVIREQA
jgi:hypothetical protein